MKQRKHLRRSKRGKVFRAGRGFPKSKRRSYGSSGNRIKYGITEKPKYEIMEYGETDNMVVADGFNSSYDAGAYANKLKSINEDREYEIREMKKARKSFGSALSNQESITKQFKEFDEDYWNYESKLNNEGKTIKSFRPLGGGKYLLNIVSKKASDIQDALASERRYEEGQRRALRSQYEMDEN